MEPAMLFTRIIEMTRPCADDGNAFSQRDRLDYIFASLKCSEYECCADLELAKVFRRPGFDPKSPFVLVSSHVDSLYGNYFSKIKQHEILGTFDNSATNAVLVDAMVEGILPEQVLITFTGNEEAESRGADQTLEYLNRNNSLRKLEMVVTLDLTEEYFDQHDVTVENYFVKSDNAGSSLAFARKKDLRKLLETMLPDCGVIKNGDPDESWRYDDHNVNCFSLCLPCRILGDDMHDDRGVAVKLDACRNYRDALETVMREFSRRLTARSTGT